MDASKMNSLYLAHFVTYVGVVEDFGRGHFSSYQWTKMYYPVDSYYVHGRGRYRWPNDYDIEDFYDGQYSLPDRFKRLK